MAVVREHAPVQLIVAAFSRRLEALAWARDRLEKHFGPVGLISEDYRFCQTHYYDESMGADLVKRFYVFERLVPANVLTETKLLTNALEAELAATSRFAE